MLGVNLRGNDWALRGLRKDIFYALYIFIFQPGSLLPVYDQPNNAATILSRPHMRNSFTNFSSSFTHTGARVYMHESRYEMYTDITGGLLDGISEQTMCGAKREKRRRTRNSNREGGRRRKRRWRWVIDFLDVTQPTHTRAFAHTYTCTRARGETLHADRPGNLFLPAPFPCTRAFRKSFEGAAKFRRIRRRAWITWIISVANITPRFCPELCALLLSQPVNSMWQLIKRVIPWLNISVEFKWLGKKPENVI